MKAKYKLLVPEGTHHITVDSFSDLCTIKGIDPNKALKLRKRSYKKLAGDTAYPCIEIVAKRAKFTEPITEDTSSKSLTKAYVTDFLILNHLAP